MLIPIAIGFGIWLLLINHDVHEKVGKKVEKYKDKLK
jgi:hypothetical protein